MRVHFCFVAVMLTSATFAGTVSPSSGKELCSALAPADFTKAGVTVTALKDANLDSDSNAYCVFESKAGKVEFDIFYPAGETPSDAAGTEKTVLAEVGGKFESIQIPGTDSAAINLNVPGKQPSASVAVQRKTAVFTINIPAGANARQQLTALAQTVLSRLQH
jgi:hypothetical protein